MANRGPLLGAAALVGVLAVGAVVGGAVGVGPLAAAVPPEKVTDPEEMLARSLQSLIDAQSVHLEANLDGSVPGALLDRPEATVALDGTRVQADARPKDARTRAQIEIPALDALLDIVTVWDGAWYRTDPAAAWSRATLGGVAADAGVDANPLTLVDRLRGYLADPEITPTVTDVACAAPSRPVPAHRPGRGRGPRPGSSPCSSPRRTATRSRPSRRPSRSTRTWRRSGRSSSPSTCAATTARWTSTSSSTRAAGTRRSPSTSLPGPDGS